MENRPVLFNNLGFSDEELDTIAGLSALNYSKEKMAMYLDVDVNQFKKAIMVDNSAVLFYIQKGKLEAGFLTQEKLLDNAKSGNITAFQEYRKTVAAQEVENVKKRILFYED